MSAPEALRHLLLQNAADDIYQSRVPTLCSGVHLFQQQTVHALTVSHHHTAIASLPFIRNKNGFCPIMNNL